MHTSTFGEELANFLTHGAGFLLAIAGLVVLVVLAVARGNAWHVVSCTVFGASLVFLYGASTLYHGIRHPGARRALLSLDQTAIYLLIAGSYTPFTLVTFRGVWGWWLFGIVWGLALVGIVLQYALKKRSDFLQTGLYLVMGWLVVIAARPAMTLLAPPAIALVVAGGLAYTLGVGFYAWRRLPYHHAVWHSFVLMGSICHFFAVVYFVIPAAG